MAYIVLLAACLGFVGASDQELLAQEHHIFDTADVDGSGFLEEAETVEFLTSSGLQGLEWRKFDKDNDSRWSFDEFHSAGAEANGVRQASLVQEDEELYSQDQEFFKTLDKDGSGFLESQNAFHEDEIAPLTKRASHSKVHAFDWREFDSDKDNRLNYAEFAESGEFVGRRAAMVQNIVDHSGTAPAADVNKVIFDEFDVDKSGFLEEAEFKHLARQSQGADIQFSTGDTDKDGRWSFDEFQKAEPENSLLEEEEQHDEDGEFDKDLESLLEEDEFEYGDEDDEEHGEDVDEDVEEDGKAIGLNTKQSGEHSWTAAQFQDVFKDVDKDADGSLDQDEVAQLQHESNWDLPDWKEFDQDKDGKLNIGEFVAASKKVMLLATSASPPQEEHHQ